MGCCDLSWWPHWMPCRPRKFGWRDVVNYWVNDGVKLAFIALWVLANFIVWTERFLYYTVNYTDSNKVRDVNKLIKWGAAFARAAAAAIKLNCALILIPVCRNFLSWLRGTWINNYLPIDKNIVFHKNIAWVIAFFAAWHTCAHLYNFEHLANLDKKKFEDQSIYPTSWSRTGPPTAWQFAWLTLAGSTGHLIVVVMVLMYSSAVESVRRPAFEAFWYTHHLFLLMFGLLCWHGSAAMLEQPTFFIWIFFPLLAYCIERTIRLFRGSSDTILQLAVAHPSKVLELQMRKAKFKFKSGQYLFLNCPYIARQEWHPFTISCAPEEEFVSVHIRIVGDWTGKLWKLLNPDDKLGVVQENLLTAPNGDPILRIDGPFGAASEDVFKKKKPWKTVVLVGAGIGVTPFASILRTVKFRRQANPDSLHLQKVYFFWISRDKYSFEWFNELLAQLEGDCDILDINVYFTGNLKEDELRRAEANPDAPDIVTGLHARTHFGRPDWSAIFRQMTEDHRGERIGVFFCGPKVLSRALYWKCRKHTDSKNGCKFVYAKENF